MHLPNFIMYPLILNHELGHANSIDRISQKYLPLSNHPCKPKIVIGDYNDCIGKKPTANINGYDIYFHSRHIRYGLTLSPMFEQFSLEEISECAKAGWMREFKTSLLFFILTLFSYYLSFINYIFYSLFGIFLIITLVELLMTFSSFHNSSDKKYYLYPKEFDFISIKDNYFDL